MGPSRTSFVADLERRLGTRLSPSEPAQAHLEALLPALDALLDGAALDASVIPLDLRDRPTFDRHVLLAVRDIPWGRTASYGEIARRIGAPRAARAVGGAVGRNPLSLIVPCHRVIAADGTIGGYGGDGPAERAEALDWKRTLLLREGVTVATRSR
jgi:methylated-DNA-[protein]-cysteine S-methyltransferase